VGQENFMLTVWVFSDYTVSKLGRLERGKKVNYWPKLWVVISSAVAAITRAGLT